MHPANTEMGTEAAMVAAKAIRAVVAATAVTMEIITMVKEAGRIETSESRPRSSLRPRHFLNNAKLSFGISARHATLIT
jgi:hypothetical protein